MNKLFFILLTKQTLLNGCFSSPKEISFSINRDTLETEKKSEKLKEKEIEHNIL